ncbi:MAG TPA: LacI family DNA-binding transcriptional regulator [Capsulimonadaceae bacterium]|nr:LacI family DNA-binding transcriptional regulator [Capsulimonadaceae bacterium]
MLKQRLQTYMVTMEDIAKRAGVSRSTASFVLNNRQAELRISAKTRQRVLDAAQELGYVRNELARAVGSGKNFVLGYLKTALGEQESLILEGVLKAASEAGYLLKLLTCHDEDSYQDAVRQCAEQRLAGLVSRGFLRPGTSTAFREGLASYGIPVVFVDDNLLLPGTTYVTSDDDHGYRLTLEYLVALGHADIAFIAGDSIHPQSVLRKESYLRVMREYGLDVPEGSVVDSNWDLNRTQELTRKLFTDQSQHPTALVCAGDELAAIAMRTLWSMGLRVPEDVSVMGYSDFSFAALLHPALTTVSQPFVEMGRVATQILLQRLEAKTPSEDLPAQVALPTSLVIRNSTSDRK